MLFKQPSFRKLFEKEASKICVTIGAYYAAFGAMAFLMIFMQKQMTPNGANGDDAFYAMMALLHHVWTIHMPLLIILGLLYVAFGLMFNKIKANKYNINLVLSLLSLALSVSYGIGSWDFIKSLSEEGPEFFKYVSYAFAAFGFVMVFIFMTVPQYIIGKKIKKMDSETSTDNAE